MNKKMKYNITISSEEPYIIKRLALDYNKLYFKSQFDIKFENLPNGLGDFVSKDEKSVNGNICIERKEINDAILSIFDGRISKQAKIMKSNGFNICAFFISGREEDIKSKINLNSYYGQLGSLIAKHRCSIYNFPNDERLIYTVLSTFKHSQVILNPEIIELSGYKKSEENIKISMISCIPGISYNIAKIIAEKYTIKELSNISDPKILTEIDKIGKIKAENIIKSFNT